MREPITCPSGATVGVDDIAAMLDEEQKDDEDNKAYHATEQSGVHRRDVFLLVTRWSTLMMQRFSGHHIAMASSTGT